MLPNLGRLSLQQADTRLIFTYDDTEKWDRVYRKKFRENKCSICIERFREGDELVVLNCKHVFHQICFEQWNETKGNCPLCRKLIDDEDLLTFEGLFLKAAKDGDLEKVTQMLQDGMDVNAQDGQNNTALIWACKRNHADVALRLLDEEGINVDLANGMGENALFCASSKKMLAVVKRLIAKDADVNKQDKNGNTPLIMACMYNQEDVALALLEEDDIEVDLANEMGENALIWASKKMLAVAKRLIEMDAHDGVNKQNIHGNTPLMMACYFNQTKIALALLEDDQTKVDLRTKNGHTALHITSEKGMLAVVEKLIEKRADVNIQARDGNTALILACDNENADVALALLEDDKIKVDLKNENGQNSLHIASEKGMLAVVEKLIEKRADVNIPDNDGRAPLTIACTDGHADVALALLEDDNIKVDLTITFNALLDLVYTKKMFAVIDKLIAKKADVNVRDNSGNTALIQACTENHAYVALALLEREDIKVDLINNGGATALHHASRNGMIEVVEKLIVKGANVNIQDRIHEYTALMIACMKKHADIALALLENDNIEVDLENEFDGTALHMAADKGMLAVVKKLIEKDADVNIQDNFRETALMIAIKNRHTDVALALLEHEDIVVNFKNKSGDTALHSASEKGMTQVVNRIREIQSMRASDDRRDTSGEGRRVRPRIRATAARRLRARLQKLV